MMTFWIVFVGVLLIYPLTYALMPKPSSRHPQHKTIPAQRDRRSQR